MNRARIASCANLRAMKFTFMSTLFAVAALALAAPIAGCDHAEEDAPVESAAAVTVTCPTTPAPTTAVVKISGQGDETVTATFVPGKGLDLSAGPTQGTHGDANFCVQDKPGEESKGVCCTFGGHLMVSCEIVSCKADGHCYDYEP